MEFVALAISLVSVAFNIFLFHRMKHQTIDVNLVYEILPIEEDIPLDAEDGSRTPVQATAEDLAAWRNRTGLPFTDYGPPPPPIAPQKTPPLSRPGGFV